MPRCSLRAESAHTSDDTGPGLCSLAPLPLLRQLLTQQLCLHLVGLLLGLPEQKISYQFLFSGSHTPPAHSAASRGVSWSAHQQQHAKGYLVFAYSLPSCRAILRPTAAATPRIHHCHAWFECRNYVACADTVMGSRSRRREVVRKEQATELWAMQCIAILTLNLTGCNSRIVCTCLELACLLHELKNCRSCTCRVVHTSHQIWLLRSRTL